MRVSLLVVASTHDATRWSLRQALTVAQPAQRLLLDGVGAPWVPGLPRELPDSGSGWEVLSCPDAGLAVQLNRALFHVHGQAFAVLEPGWAPEPGFMARAAALLAAHPELDLVSCPYVRDVVGDCDEQRLPGVELEHLLGSLDAVPSGVVVRRTAWERVDGYDESLPDEVVGWDLAVRLLAAGASAAQLEDPGLRLVVERDPGRRDRWTRERRVAASRAVFTKHQALFEAHVASALVIRDAEQHAQHARCESLTERKLSLEHELLVADARLRELNAALERQPLPWGGLRRALPVSRDWGYDRGEPIDRRYIEQHLAAHAADVRGRVLEIQEPDYARRYGEGRLQRVDVLDVNRANPRATILADLRHAPQVPTDSFDCLIVTQTIHVIDDMPSVLRECRRILKPGGVLLLTLPCVSRICLEYGTQGDFWRVTPAGARQLVEGAFPSEQVEVTTFGNALVSAAFLQGLARHELTPDEYDVVDPYNPTLVGVRAVKPGAPAVHDDRPPEAGLVLGYHRVADTDADVHQLCVPPSALRRHLEQLRRGWQVLALPEFSDRLAAGDLPPRAVSLTVDDGYPDALDTLAPLLAELELPATCFLTTAPADDPQPFWWDTLEALLLGSVTLPGRLQLSHRDQVHRFDLEAVSPRQVHDALHPLFVSAGVAEREHLLRQLLRWLGHDPRPRLPTPLNAAGIRGLAGCGLGIGAHGVHHLALAHQRLEDAQAEVLESKTRLEAIIGAEVSAFCYPYGSVDDQAVSLVKTAGFRLGVTCEPDWARPGVDLARLPRLVVPAGVVDLEAWLGERLASRP